MQKDQVTGPDALRPPKTHSLVRMAREAPREKRLSPCLIMPQPILSVARRIQHGEILKQVDSRISHRRR